MPFSLKNHSVLSWNALLLLAAFLLAAGCGPASSGSGQSQPPAAAATQPAAETVTQGTGPVPETLWDKRADYEKEGQVVLFTDCGLYKGDTDELTGAKCEFKDGRWVLLEPKLEPKDNLIKNGDFSKWSFGHGPFTKQGFIADYFKVWNAGNTRDLVVKPYFVKTEKFSPFSLHFETKTGGVELLQNVGSNDLKYIKNHFLTLSFFIGFSKIYRNSLTVGIIELSDTSKKQNDFFARNGQNIFIIGPLDFNTKEITFFMRLNNSGFFVADNFIIYHGILPMI